ncbi:MAG: hypothetical protein H0W12_03420 [Chitinophagaceae bacterium]|nr:hypothetical protein [Chitinophagaceae bacterium]
MSTVSINEIKKELVNLSHAQLSNVCLLLAKYKKDNKELLAYILFQSDDRAGYIERVKRETDEKFKNINSSNLYFAKKSIRKILRDLNKHIRYTSSKETEVELLMYFCQELKNSGIPIHKSVALNNLYKSQIKKIEKTIALFHEDLQHDYSKIMETL